MSIVEGYTTDNFASLRDVFEGHLTNGEDVGASIAVMLRGEMVADIWGGYVDEAMTRPWQRDTILNVWSVTKTMTFLVAMMLSDRGELDLDAPVAKYWPEFAQSGKESIAVRHVMGHTSGLSGFDAALKPEDLADWDLCVGALAAQAPWWDSRTTSGYHLVTQGYLIGELVRRITGTSFAEFFKSEVHRCSRRRFPRWSARVRRVARELRDPGRWQRCRRDGRDINRVSLVDVAAG